MIRETNLSVRCVLACSAYGPPFTIHNAVLLPENYGALQ